MENILILGSKCFDNADAGGICSRNLMQGLLNENQNVFLLGYSYNDESIDSLNIKKENEFEFKYKKKETNKIIKRLKAYKQIFIQNVNYDLVNKYFEHACKMIDEKNITTVISIYYPIESLVVLKKIKQKYNHLKVLDYEVDSSIDISEYTSRLSKYRISTNINYLKKLYEYFDFIFVMKSHIDKVLEVFEEYKNKIKLIDVPFLIDRIKYEDAIKKDTFDFLYVGLLDKDIYSPEPLLKMMELNRDKDNWRLHFIARGNCEDMVNNIAKQDKRIIYHGYVEYEEAKLEMAKADVLLSIEYKSKPSSIPSKVFNYISVCKPVIHFSSNKYTFFNDEYIKKYPLGLRVNDEFKDEDNKKVLGFIDNINNISIDYKDVRDIFYMNTPEYSARLILSLLGDKHS